MIALHLRRLRLLVTTLLLSASWSPAAPLRVLFIGNSYTHTNNIPGIVAEIARANGHELDAAMHLPGGRTWQRHWDEGTAAALIRENRWDAIVLQNQSYEPVGDPANMLAYGRRFGDLIREAAPHARIVLYNTWAYLDLTSPAGHQQRYPAAVPPATSEEMQDRIDAAYRTVAAALDAEIAPVGPAWRRALAAEPTYRLHGPDGSHPNPRGAYLAALVLYQTLFGEPAVELPTGFNLPGRAGTPDAPPLTITLTPDECAFLAAQIASPVARSASAAVRKRLTTERSPAALLALDAAAALNALTAAERHDLGTDTVRFQIDRPARVWVAHPERNDADLFWLRDQGFVRTDAHVTARGWDFALWSRDCEVGEIALGITSFDPNVPPYFAFVSPLVADASPPQVTALSPTALRTTRAERGASIYVEVNFPLTALPDQLDGSTLVRTRWDSRAEEHLTRRFRATPLPAGPVPDQIVLTWAGDPRTTQTIQWRTAPTAAPGSVRYLPREQWLRLRDRPAPQVVPARAVVEVTPDVANDPRMHRQRVELVELSPDTEYIYEIVGADGVVTPPAAFRTAPAVPRDFSFLYMGDVQNGFERWSALLDRARTARPDAAFLLLAGDLVDRGAQRDDWDAFLGVAAPTLARIPLVPVVGNHECQGDARHPSLYLTTFGLPPNGPAGIERGRAYHFTYGDTLFVVLDSNLDPATQTAWLDTALGETAARWKIVSFHHPIHGSDPARGVAAVKEAWMPVLERHGVDLVLQGHDHAYLRTHPLRDGVVTTDPDVGTTYVVAVAGTKMYSQGDYPTTARGYVNLPTWQVIDLSFADGTLHYRAYDADGALRDEFVRRKSRTEPALSLAKETLHAPAHPIPLRHAPTP